MFDCDIRWDLNAKPYVWLNGGNDTPLGKEIAALGDIERRELAYQLMSMHGRGEDRFRLNGVWYRVDLGTFFIPTAEDRPLEEVL